MKGNGNKITSKKYKLLKCVEELTWLEWRKCVDVIKIYTHK